MLEALHQPRFVELARTEVYASWDVTNLRGPVRWSSCQLNVILDIFSRNVVGRMVAHRGTRVRAGGSPSAERVGLPGQHEVELPAASGVRQAIEASSGDRGPTHAVIDELGRDVPTPRTGELARFVELQPHVRAMAVETRVQRAVLGREEVGESIAGNSLRVRRPEPWFRAELAEPNGRPRRGGRVTRFGVFNLHGKRGSAS